MVVSAILRVVMREMSISSRYSGLKCAADARRASVTDRQEPRRSDREKTSRSDRVKPRTCREGSRETPRCSGRHGGHRLRCDLNDVAAEEEGVDHVQQWSQSRSSASKGMSDAAIAPGSGSTG